MLRFLIKGKQYESSKAVLKEQMKKAENNQLDKKSTMQLPSWVQSEQFDVIHQYLSLVDGSRQLEQQEKQQKINLFLKKSILSNGCLNSAKRFIHIMRVSDYLTLYKFQQFFIQKCVIQTLNSQNCILYLEETHTKLRNSSSGTAQAWYNLLNACIDYISYNLSDVYLLQPQKIEKLHEKIIGQILDRTIKYQLVLLNKENTRNTASNEPKEKQIIFNLLMKSKKVNSVDALCNSLKKNLAHKKINKKMHAKLSWKLHELHQIVDRKVKNFKFLDLDWILQAIRSPDRKLRIKLSLLGGQQQSKKQRNNYCMGVFYSKLYWSSDRLLGLSQVTEASQGQSIRDNQYQNLQQTQLTQGQKPLQTHYICLRNPSSPIDVFQIDSQFERSMESRKLELSIYCSIDQCYSFIINYIVNDYSKLRLDESKISKQELYAIIEGSKSTGKHSQAVWLIKHLAKNQLEIPPHLLQNLPYDKLPTYQTQFLKKLVRNDNSILDQVFGKKQVNTKTLQMQSSMSSLSSSKVSENVQTRSNHSRALSRGRTRKIFGQSPQKDIHSSIDQSDRKTYMKKQPLVQTGNLLTRREQELQEVMQIINIKNYFYDQNSPIFSLI